MASSRATTGKRSSMGSIRSSYTPRPLAGVRIMPMGLPCWTGPWRISRAWAMARSILLEESLQQTPITIIDEYTRECLAIEVARRLDADAVLHRLTELFV